MKILPELKHISTVKTRFITAAQSLGGIGKSSVVETLSAFAEASNVLHRIQQVYRAITETLQS